MNFLGNLSQALNIKNLLKRSTPRFAKKKTKKMTTTTTIIVMLKKNMFLVL